MISVDNQPENNTGLLLRPLLTKSEKAATLAPRTLGTILPDYRYIDKT